MKAWSNSYLEVLRIANEITLELESAHRLFGKYATRDVMRIALISTRVIAVLCVFVGSAFAQWLGYPTPGIPRTKDGKPNLTAPAPKTREGRADLSGIWLMMYPKDVFARLVKEGVGPNLRDLMPEGTEIPLAADRCGLI